MCHTKRNKYIMFNLSTKEKREESRNYQFDYLVKNGYTREDYKSLVIFQNDLTLKVFSGTAAHHILYTRYRSIENVETAKENIKASHDRNQQRKTEAKGNKTLSSAAQAAAAIREELKQFAGVKFTVKSENFAGGNSVHIGWTDGPTSEMVNDIIKKYQYGHFNGMEDIYENTNSRNDIPQAKYVSGQRDRSPETEAQILEDIKKEYSAEYLTELRDHELQNMIYRKFNEMDLSTPSTKTEATPGKVETKAGEVTLIDYSEKSFAVIGDTKPIKDKLKNLGGKFNFRLTCGAGWVFPKTSLEKVQAALSEPTKVETLPEVIKAIEETPDPEPIRRAAEDEVIEYTNIEDITKAAESGQVISLCNLANILNNGRNPQLNLI